jgi:tight adherence protein B
MSDQELGIAIALVFCAVVLFVFGAYSFWNQAFGSGKDMSAVRIDQLEKEGHVAESKKLSLARQVSISRLDQVFLGVPGYHHVDRMIEQAGLQYGPGGLFLRITLFGLAGAMLGMLLSRGIGMFPLVIGFLAGAALPVLRIRRRRKLRLKRLVSQLPDAMDFFARSLRAGNPFVGALRSAPEEMAQPIARELEITFEEMNYGLDFEEVMQNLASRIDAEEVRFFVTAVLVQKKTGGNLAEIMNRIASLLRERIKTRGEVMVQAAEMKASANVLIALPIVVAGALQILNPGYFLVMLDHPTGLVLVYVQLGMMLVGYLIMRRMVNFRI